MAKFTLAVCTLGLLLIALVVSGQEPETRDVKPGKTFCTKEFSPVCGSDGKTYGNMCEFGNAKAVKSDLTFRTGACDEPSE